MTDPDGSRQLVEQAASTDKQLHILTDMWHIITKEPGNEKILAQVIEWVNERL
jgi:esterase/lipase